MMAVRDMMAATDQTWNATLIGGGVLLADRWESVLDAVSVAAPHLAVGGALAALLWMSHRSRSLAARS